MKQIVWTTAALFAMTCLSACSSKDTDTPESAPKTNDSAETQSGEEQTAFSVQSEKPDQAVEQFLSALRSGDQRVAEALLTNKARTETKRHNMVVQPPGTPNATHKVGRVEYPDGEDDAAFVHCVWSETFPDNSVESFEVVWVLRFEHDNWRIAGMATQLSDNTDPVFLNFEDPAEMMETVNEADNAARQENVAETPDGTPATVR